MQFKEISSLYQQAREELEKNIGFNQVSIIKQELFTHYFTEISTEECNEFLKLFLDEDAKFGYKFTHRFLESMPHDDAGYQTQTNFLKFALDYGVDIATIITDVRLSLKFLSLNQELLLNHPTNSAMNADIFLKIVLESYAYNNLKEMKYELTKYAIKLGANVNTGWVEENILDIVKEPEIINLLREHGAECGTASKSIDSFIGQHNLEHYFDNIDGLSQILNQKLLSPAQYINNIPYIMHYVWLTHQSNPREIRSTDIENIINTKEMLGNNLAKWSYIIWTNNKNLIPVSTKILEEDGIEVRSIQGYKEELRLFEPIMDMADKKLWGLASDTLRYSVIEKFGGIYSDLNFKFLRSIEKNLYQYDFIFQGSNNFFAAKPNHPITKHVLDVVENHYSSPPEYLTSLNDIFHKTIISTLIPFIVAFLEYNNQGDNVDVTFNQYYDSGNQGDNVDVTFNQYYDSGLDDQKQCTTNQKFFALNSKFNISGIENIIVGVDNDDIDEISWL